MIKQRLKALLLLLPCTYLTASSQEVKSNAYTVHITIPTLPKVPQPVTVQTTNGSELGSRTIQFSKRVPPGYIPPEKRATTTQSNQTSTIGVGEVDKGRIATYLRAPYMDVQSAKKALQKAGFRIIAVTPIDKEEELSVIVFTDDALEKFASSNQSEFLASLRLLVNKKDRQISITNPLYLSKAFTDRSFDITVPKETLNKIRSHFAHLSNSKEKLKFQLLPSYQFMNGMPQYKDMITIETNKDIIEHLKDRKEVVFKQKLPNGAVLLGIEFSDDTQSFPNNIGTKNAALLPYPLLIKENKAYMMDPRYYISVMYPLLQMSEFMKIAAIPDTMIQEIQTILKKKN